MRFLNALMKLTMKRNEDLTLTISYCMINEEFQIFKI